MKKPKANEKRYFTVYEAVFQRKIHILLNFVPKDYEKWLNKMKAVDVGTRDFSDFSGFSTSLDIDGKPTDWIIYVKNFDWTIENQGTLIHEIVHTIIKIWQSNNIPYNQDTQEFLAHSIANLYEEIARKIFYPKKR